jgi:CRP-like cAMP-binding protein
MIDPQQLIRLRPFARLPREAARALAAVATELRFSDGAVLFRTGAPPRGCYIVLDGTVRVVRRDGGRQHVVHTEGPGGTLGEIALFTGTAHPATGIAVGPVRCALLTREALERAIAGSPRVAFLLLERLAARGRHLVERLEERSSRSVRDRLIAWLRGRAESRPVGPASHQAVVVSIGMTQQALAEELGTVREVVARELRALRRAGVLTALGGGRYRLSV